MKTCICLAAVPYRSMKQRPQHIADILTERNYRVIYININEEYQPVDSKSFNGLDNASEESLLKGLEGLRCAEEVKPNLHVVKKVTIFEDERRGLADFLVKLQNCFGEENTFIYVQFPTWVDYMEGLSERVKIIYDCLDDWEAFVRDLDLGYEESLIFKERKLASLSDMIMASSIKLYAKMACINERVIYIPNGVSTEDYRRDPVFPEDLEGIEGPIVFFMGSLAGWVDKELIAFLAKERPNYPIVLVGPTWLKEKRLRAKNIFYLGQKRYEKLVNYIKQVRVAIVPFKVNKLTISVTPLKFFEYISAGVPAVTTLLPDLEGIPGGRVAQDHDDFLKQIDYIVNLDEKGYKELSVAALESSRRFEWSSLIGEMLSYIENPGRIESIDTGRFISERIDTFKRFSANPIIRNELLFLSNLIGDYRWSIELGEELLASKSEIDYNQLALAFFREGDYKRSIELLISFCKRSSSGKLGKAWISYIESLLKGDEDNRLLEIILLKACGFHMEAINRLDGYMSEKGCDPISYGLFAGLLIEIHEVEAALNAVIRAFELSSGEDLAHLLDPGVLVNLIEPLITRGEYDLAEKLALMLYNYRLDDIAVEKLGDIYLQSHLEAVIIDKREAEKAG